MTATFRKHYTSDLPGMETCTIHGKEKDEAIRVFLKQLEKEKAGDSEDFRPL